MSKLLSHPPALCNAVRRIAIEAGEITLSYFEEGMMLSCDSKEDGSPVTQADREAEAHIIKELQSYFPDIPVIGEESAMSEGDRDLSSHEYFWLVDPLDGTRQFIAGNPEFTVNIALIKNGVPVLGVIHAPFFDETYAAFDGGVPVKFNEATGHEKEIRVRKPSSRGLIVMASHNRSAADLERYLEEYKVEKILRRGSSLKICAVAAGKADIYPCLGDTCEWDTAAGHAILRAAGGDIVSQETGLPLTYGHMGRQFINPSFLARGFVMAEE